MKVAIRLTRREKLKAIPILLRHSPGMILRDGTHIISEEATEALRKAGVKFTEVSRESNTPSIEGALSGERV
jgi:hypothetical protein